MRRSPRVAGSLILAAAVLSTFLCFPAYVRAQDGGTDTAIGASDSAPASSSGASEDGGGPDGEDSSSDTAVIQIKRISPNTLTQKVFDQLLLLQTPPLEPHLPDIVDADVTNGATVTIAGVRWQADTTPFDAGIPGDYVFTPVLPAGYAFSHDADIVPIEVHIVLPDDNSASDDASSDEASSDGAFSDGASSDGWPEYSSSSGSSSENPPEAPETPSAAPSEPDIELALPGSVPAPEIPPESGPEATPDKTTVLVTVVQEDIREGQLLPWPRVRINGSYAFPDGTMTRQYSDYGTIGGSGYTEDSLPSAPGRYTVAVTYETETHRGVGSTDFTIHPRGGPLPPNPPDLADVTIDPLYSSSSRRNLLRRIEDISGFRGVSDRRVHYMDIRARDAGSDLTGRRVILRYPAGTSRRTHDFVLVHEYRPGYVERVSISEERYGISFSAGSLSPFALAWRYASTDHGEDSGGDENHSSFKEGEYDFWMDVRRTVSRADSGDFVVVRARGFDKMPEVVMRALRDNDGVSMKIIWNGGRDIIIPAGEAQTPDGLRIFWPLRRLADLYDGASLTADILDKENLPDPPPDPAPSSSSAAPAAPPPSGSAASEKPYPSTGGFWRADAPQTPASATPAKTPAGVGVAKSVEEAELARSHPSVLLDASDLIAGAAARDGERVPDSLILVLVLLTVCSLFGIFSAVWLIKKKPTSKY